MNATTTHAIDHSPGQLDAIGNIGNPGAVAIRAGWAVVTTHPQAETWAAVNLRRWGYRVFLPTFTAIVPKNGASPPRTAIRPLFPNYAFVWLNTAKPWGRVRSAPGVRSLLMDGPKPGYARTASVEALQASEALRRTPTPPGAVWRPGDACRVSTGPFRGRDAVITRIRGDSATVTVLFLGGMQEIVVNVINLAPRDERD